MSTLIISIPLTSALIVYLLGRKIGYRGGRVISITSMLINIALAIAIYKENIEGKVKGIRIKEWYEVGQQISTIELIYNKESVIMVLLISLITAIVIIYSYWYLGEDAHINRFVAYLLLFAVSMYILVTSKNYTLIFLGWEGVGIISYLLINYWYTSIANNKSALKALVFNKIGDIAYMYAIVSLMYINTETNTIMYYNPLYDSFYISIVWAIIIASMAKSAQILLHCWLGDAMAGPTPVSALLHAATMVTAGIYLLIKISPIIHLLGENSIEIIIIMIGLITILFGGLASMYQYDIKKIIAYSTCAQIGYMFYAITYILPSNSSLYHLLTHGFFKALLFLSAGLIIHNLLLEQDIRKYGSLLHTFPLFYISFFIGTLALIGTPMLAGYYSKDVIILQSFSYKSIAICLILILASLLSSLYSLRLMYIAFISNTNINTHINHPITLKGYAWMTCFFVLYLGAYYSGYLFNDILASPDLLSLDTEFNIANTPIVKIILIALPLLALGYINLYNSTLKNPLLNRILISLIPYFNRRFYFDSFYNYYVSLPVLVLSYHYFYKCIDRGFLELFGPLGLLRLFFSPYRSYNLYQQNTSNLPYLFFFFFLALFGVASTSLLLAFLF